MRSLDLCRNYGLLCLVALSFTLVSITFAQQSAFQTSVDEVQERENVPGLVFMTVEAGNNTIYASGVRKSGEDTPIEQSDILHLGSLTKAMTATLVAKLIENNTLAWNTSIGDVFANSDFTIDDAYTDVTVEMLASHRSGFTNDTTLGDQDFWLRLWNASEVAGRITYLTRALSLAPTHDAAEYLYSNVNYVVLGHIVDVLVGPWESVIESQLFEPFDMVGCGFGAAPQSSPEAIDNPWPHLIENGQIVPLPSNTDNPRMLGPAGTVHCPAASYANFLRMHLDAEIGCDNNSFLQSESWTKLHTPWNGPGEQYTPGGWLWEDFEGEGVRLAHDGSNGANSALAYIFAGRQLALFAFANVYEPNGFRATRSIITAYLDQAGNSTETSVNNVSKLESPITIIATLLVTLLYLFTHI